MKYIHCTRFLISELFLCPVVWGILGHVLCKAQIIASPTTQETNLAGPVDLLQIQ